MTMQSSNWRMWNVADKLRANMAPAVSLTPSATLPSIRSIETQPVPASAPTPVSGGVVPIVPQLPSATFTPQLPGQSIPVQHAPDVSSAMDKKTLYIVAGVVALLLLFLVMK